MTNEKYITAYTPNEEDCPRNRPYLSNNVKDMRLVVIHKGRIHVLAHFRCGYASEKSQKVYAYLEINPTNGAEYSCVYGNARGDECDALYSVLFKVFDTSESGWFSPDMVLAEIARFFGFKNFRVLG